MGDAANVSMGPGTIYVAPLGTSEPASATAALDAAWREVGYTEEGSTFVFETTTADVEVAEEFYPVAVKTTKVAAGVRFQMAEATRENLALAINVGADAANTGALEPVAAGSEVRVMILVDKENGARWLFRRAFQGGTVEIRNAKAPDKTLIPVDFRLEKPSGAEPWKVYPSLETAGLI